MCTLTVIKIKKLREFNNLFTISPLLKRRMKYFFKILNLVENIFNIFFLFIFSLCFFYFLILFFFKPFFSFFYLINYKKPFKLYAIFEN